jgi:tRNA(adenine34) deaminase
MNERLHRYERLMRRALEVARAPVADAPSSAEAAKSQPTGDVPVGAVVFGPDGAELGSGHNERERVGDPTAHAEIIALRRAAMEWGQWRLDGCTLVVTLEPCTMCAGAVVLARVATLVFGAWEPKTGAVGSLWDVVRDSRLNHRPEVYGGVLEDECGELLRGFFADKRDL